MKILVPPTVDPDFHRMNGLQRATDSLRYALLRWEYWVSPTGDMREWLRRNSYVGAWLLIPALFVLPVVGLSCGKSRVGCRCSPGISSC